MKKCFSVLIILILLLLPFGMSINAETTFVPYDTYEYNSFNEAIDTPVGYYPSQILDSPRLNLEKSFNNITDIVFKNEIIYVLDSENSRIVLLDANYKVTGVYSEFRVGNKNRDKLVSILGGEATTFAGANGMTVSANGTFYIADTMNNRILCISKDGFIENIILRPDEALNNTNAAFSPSKIEIDDKNRIYVTSKDIALGIMIFDSEGKFIQFFGANEVLSNTQALVKTFRKFFMSVTQLELVEQSTPVTIRNMDFTDDGFLYTVSPYRDETVKSAVPGLLRKLNYKGNDILDDSLVFGDLEEDDVNKTWFQDVDIDNKGFINLLDENRGRIFQYTDSGMLLAVFGSKGDRVGCFTNPTAIESVNDDILVADKDKNCIFVYSPTEYAKTIRNAVLKMDSNDLAGSVNEWKTLSEMNSNSYFAYEGLGRVYDYQGDYKTAMKYFKLAYDQTDYALSFQQHRQQILENNVLLILISVIAVLTLIVIAVKKVKKLTVPETGSAYSRLEQKNTLPFYILVHPVDGCAQFKRRNITSMTFSAGIIISWIIIRILSYNFTGFAFSVNRNIDFNMLVELFLTVGVFTAFVISNWFISILLEGKGTARDIIATTAYSLIPYLVTQGIKIILTNVLVPSESVFIQIITTIGIVWTVAVLFTGLMTIHEFSVGKTIGSILLTLVGIVIIVFLIILLYSLVQQLGNFISSVYHEIIFRI